MDEDSVKVSHTVVVAVRKKLPICWMQNIETGCLKILFSVIPCGTYIISVWSNCISSSLRLNTFLYIAITGEMSRDHNSGSIRIAASSLLHSGDTVLYTSTQNLLSSFPEPLPKGCNAFNSIYYIYIYLLDVSALSTQNLHHLSCCYCSYIGTW